MSEEIKFKLCGFDSLYPESEILKKEIQMPKFEVTAQEMIDEWMSKDRRMGCVSATTWAVKRLEGFKPLRIIRYTPKGEVYEHVVAFNGKIIIDLAPYADAPEDKTGPNPWNSSSDLQIFL